MELLMRHLLVFAAILLTASAQAETPHDFLTRFEQEAGAVGAVERGAKFFTSKQGGE
jgi:hypothetical protein